VEEKGERERGCWLCGATTGTKGLRACLQKQREEVILCVVKGGVEERGRVSKVGWWKLRPTSSK